MFVRHYRSILVATLLLLCEASAIAQSSGSLEAARRDLMPVPASVAWRDGRLPVDKNFSFKLAGQTDERTKQYVSRVMRRLEGRTIFEFVREQSTAATPTLLVETASTGNAIPKLGDDESYTLDISPTGIKLNAPNSVGAMRGLETLLQLLEGDANGFYFPAVSISDRPRFAWRGLMVDSARHFQPVEVIKRTLDGMASVKLNVLHWHLTEDQGFRVETKRFPELYLQGSDGLFYTQAEIRDIIRYAADRGIRVMPEFDMPGHATAWVVSHPEIASGPGPYTIERRPGIFDPTLDPTNEKTYKLLEPFFADMAALFPDAYMHIGGDENEGKQWDANANIQAFMKKNGIKNNHELQTYFNKRLLKFLQKNGKVMMGWDEIFQPDLPKDVVIHSWRGQKALADAAKQGFQGVLSNGYYIDLVFSASQHYVVDPLPADTTLSTDEQKRVLGGEATMWAEWVSAETIDSRIWPRTAAIAERLWSPREVNDVDDMYRRLEVVSIRLEELGLTHIRNQKVLLRRLAMGKDTAALETLVSLIEPVKEYKRYQARPQTMLSPLTGLIDAAQPDAPNARIFNRAVERFIAGGNRAELLAELRSMVESWQRHEDRLAATVASSPALAEARQLPEDLRALNRIALEAIIALTNGSSQTAEWRAARIAELEAIAKPKAAVEFVSVNGVRKLVDAAAGVRASE
ncbi:MAG: family 20 glycosylhydrolase [Pyrinomonadaceae bacterium]